MIVRTGFGVREIGRRYGELLRISLPPLDEAIMKRFAAKLFPK